MATAVAGLSPVIILTLTPAELHFLTAPGTAYLMGSLMPTIPKIIRSFSISDFYEFWFNLSSSL